jgi:hypothetical protein
MRFACIKWEKNERFYKVSITGQRRCLTPATNSVTVKLSGEKKVRTTDYADFYDYGDFVNIQRNLHIRSSILLTAIWGQLLIDEKSDTMCANLSPNTSHRGTEHTENTEVFLGLVFCLH